MGDNSELVPKHFFSDIVHFPNITEDGKIETNLFLTANRAFIKVFDYLGAPFYMIKKDMMGNVETLSKVLKKDPEKYKYLNDLVFIEKTIDPTRYAVNALLWLKRALEFIVEFISGVKNDCHKEDQCIDSIALTAYDLTIKKYHGWFIQGVFKTVVKAAPSRNKFAKSLYYGKDGPTDIVLDAASAYVTQVKTNIVVIVKIYDELDLNDERKV